MIIIIPPSDIAIGCLMWTNNYVSLVVGIQPETFEFQWVLYHDNVVIMHEKNDESFYADRIVYPVIE